MLDDLNHPRSQTGEAQQATIPKVFRNTFGMSPQEYKARMFL